MLPAMEPILEATGLIRVSRKAELADAARSTVLLARILGLVDYLGKGRPVTSEGMLDVEEARALIVEFDLGRDYRIEGTYRLGGLGEPEDFEELSTLTSMHAAVGVKDVAQFRPLNRLWKSATACGWVTVDKRTTRTATRGSVADEYESSTDAQVLDRWWFLARSFMAVDGRDRFIDQDTMEVVLAYLCARPRPMPFDELMEVLRGAFPFSGDLEDVEVAESVRPFGLKRALWLAEQAGLVTTQEMVRIELTPLGIWYLVRVINDEYQYPLAFLGDPDETETGMVVLALTRFPDETEEFFAAWVERLGRLEAARTLLEYFSEAHAAGRMLTGVLLGRFDKDVAAAFEAALENPATQAYAQLWLFERDLRDEPYRSEEDRLWLYVDVYAGWAAMREVATVLPRNLQKLGNADHLEILADLDRIAHHENLEMLLAAMVEHAPDDELRTAAQAILDKIQDR